MKDIIIYERFLSFINLSRKQFTEVQEKLAIKNTLLTRLGDTH
jgi:hypothetical protein